MKKNNKIIIRITLAIVLIISIIFKNVEDKNKLENEAINHSNIIAVYLEQEDGTYKETNDIPEGYQINSSKSVCSNGAKISGITPNINISSLNKNNTSCYLYLDKIKSLKTLEKLKLTSKGKYNETDSFTDIATADDTGIYETEDDYGTSYYFRGLNDSLNNWVQFAGFYWRIIRINGNGSIRMIYSGVANGNPSSANKTGETTQIEKSAYNSSDNDNAYVGYMYGNTGSSSYNATHTNTNNSTIKAALDSWYSSNLVDVASKIDTNAGFCNDREINNSAYNYSGNGAGTSATSYASLGRLMTNNNWNSSQTPTLKCTNKDRDLFTVRGASVGNHALTYPVGLITSDEVVYAGGFGGTNNVNYYLYTGQYYWTISPSNMSYYGGDVRVLRVDNDGGLFDGRNVNGTIGARPVINLKSNVTMTGTGSETDPFIVQED